MFRVLIIGLGGFLGAIGRYGVAGLVHRFASASFPTGTLVVNLVGCLLVGGLMFLAETRQFFTPEARLFLLVGFLGSFTTLSTVGYETFELLRAGDFRLAAVNAGVNLFLCVGAVVLGWIGARAFGI